MPYGDEKSYSFFKMKGHTLPGPFQKNGTKKTKPTLHEGSHGGLTPNPNVPPPGTKTKTKEIKKTESQEELIKKFKENIPTPGQKGYPKGTIGKILKTEMEQYFQKL